jgi:hypothetical protein
VQDERYVPEDSRSELSDPTEPFQQPVESSIEDAVQDGEDGTYFPPTDPVLTTDEHGDPQMLGGFAGSAGEDISVAASAVDGRGGDEAIADAIRRELRRDAATAGLDIDVEVQDGVARLRGRVEDIVDGENAEEVASRVPGVNEVIDETEVDSL